MSFRLRRAQLSAPHQPSLHRQGIAVKHAAFQSWLAATAGNECSVACGCGLQGTNPADLEGLSSLRSSLSLTAGQIVELKWGRSKEPCGRPTCPLNQCSWNGIACTNWRVTELDISSRIVTETPLLLGGTLPPQLSNLSMLESINASGHT